MMQKQKSPCAVEDKREIHMPARERARNAGMFRHRVRQVQKYPSLQKSREGKSRRSFPTHGRTGDAETPDVLEDKWDINVRA